MAGKINLTEWLLQLTEFISIDWDKMIRFSQLIILLFLLVSCRNKNRIQEIKTFSSYPSASGIENFNNQFYIIGDDANNLLILDINLNSIDSVSIFPFSGQRMPKSIKADLESISITKTNEILLLGSGALSPYRNSAWLIDPHSREKKHYHLDTFYQRLKLTGLKELNIEGSCVIQGSFLLSNRGNKSNLHNHLIITNENFFLDQSGSVINVMSIGVNDDSTIFSGVSGLAYSKMSDRLIITISTEDTNNVMDDGAIGKSYLWIVNNISSKLKWKAINPNRVIDLEKLDPRFKGQKIESACIEKETDDYIHLVLVSDNDNGSSTLFSVILD